MLHMGCLLFISRHQFVHPSIRMAHREWIWTIIRLHQFYVQISNGIKSICVLRMKSESWKEWKWHVWFPFIYLLSAQILVLSMFYQCVHCSLFILGMGFHSIFSYSEVFVRCFFENIIYCAFFHFQFVLQNGKMRNYRSSFL